MLDARPLEEQEFDDVLGFLKQSVGENLTLDYKREISPDKDKDKAKEILVSLRQRFDKPDESPGKLGIPQGPAFPYLREVAMDRLRALDPSAAPKQPSGAPGGGAQLSPAQIKKMIEDAQKKGAAGSGGGH